MALAASPWLPVDHPDYRYPPCKNPYWTKIQDLGKTVLIDHQTEENRGNWRSQFRASGNSTLHVEIGCNAGHVISSWAARNPDQLYIGIDWKNKAVFRAASKAIQGNLKNLTFCRAHANRIHYVFGPQEVDHLYLFFPDPWPKKCHWKNRFINPSNLRQIATILKPGGTFHIKTDHRGYFDQIKKAVSETAALWSVLEESTDLHQGHPAPELLDVPEVTLFEKIFIRQKVPICQIRLEKINEQILTSDKEPDARKPECTRST